MNPKAIYILPFYSDNDEDLFKSFDGLLEPDITFLKSTLYFNILENLEGKVNNTDIYCIWDATANDQLPEELKNEDYKIIFTNLKNRNELIDKLSTKEFLLYKKNLIVLSDAIAIRSSDYEQYFNLLNVENNSLVIAKTKEDYIAVFGFNNPSNEVISSLVLSNFIYNDFLSRIKSCEHFMHILNDVLLVRDISNFKQLYSELSQKKSMEYCSQKMHERFTHLFVEYKDIVK
ncbi:MAG TPA: hypothetical protein DHV28_11010 [Ignavibacteriales bacterium]|nr:hypothetical protein [Ignavibacteriales bacterium]